MSDSTSTIVNKKKRGVKLEHLAFATAAVSAVALGIGLGNAIYIRQLNSALNDIYDIAEGQLDLIKDLAEAS